MKVPLPLQHIKENHKYLQTYTRLYQKRGGSEELF